jgi:hypothetical protein
MLLHRCKFLKVEKNSSPTQSTKIRLRYGPGKSLQMEMHRTREIDPRHVEFYQYISDHGDSNKSIPSNTRSMSMEMMNNR